MVVALVVALVVDLAVPALEGHGWRRSHAKTVASPKPVNRIDYMYRRRSEGQHTGC